MICARQWAGIGGNGIGMMKPWLLSICQERGMGQRRGVHWITTRTMTTTTTTRFFSTTATITKTRMNFVGWNHVNDDINNNQQWRWRQRETCFQQQARQAQLHLLTCWFSSSSSSSCSSSPSPPQEQEHQQQETIQSSSSSVSAMEGESSLEAAREEKTETDVVAYATTTIDNHQNETILSTDETEKEVVSSLEKVSDPEGDDDDDDKETTFTVPNSLLPDAKVATTIVSTTSASTTTTPSSYSPPQPQEQQLSQQQQQQQPTKEQTRPLASSKLLPVMEVYGSNKTTTNKKKSFKNQERAAVRPRPLPSSKLFPVKLASSPIRKKPRKKKNKPVLVLGVPPKRQPAKALASSRRPLASSKLLPVRTPPPSSSLSKQRRTPRPRGSSRRHEIIYARGDGRRPGSLAPMPIPSPYSPFAESVASATAIDDNYTQGRRRQEQQQPLQRPGPPGVGYANANTQSPHPPRAPFETTVAAYLQQQQGQKSQRPRSLVHSKTTNTPISLPQSSWIQITGIPPLSSLEVMVAGIDLALDTICQEQGGIVDLEAPFWIDPNQDPSLLLPLLPDTQLTPRRIIATLEQPQETTDSSSSSSSSSHQLSLQRWIEKAKLRLSSYGRPNGWFIKFRNRSIVHALLQYTKSRSIFCGWKPVHVQAYSLSGDNTVIHEGDNHHHQDKSATSGQEKRDKEERNVLSNTNFMRLNNTIAVTHDDENDKSEGTKQQQEQREPVLVTDATVRLEECPNTVSLDLLLKTFSRFDLATDRDLQRRGILTSIATTTAATGSNTKNPNKNDAVGGCIIPWNQQWQDPGSTQQRGRQQNDVPFTCSATYLVHFASPAWARAAVREKQGTPVHNGHFVLRLAQYPKQIL